MKFLEKKACLIMAAMRIAVGWHLAYNGVWALTSEWTHSWGGVFRCAHWLFGGVFRTIGGSSAMGVVDVALAWTLLIVGFLLMFGRLARVAAVVGILYLAMIYIVNPPHFGHTGESHFLYVDRNVIEIFMLLCVIAWRGDATAAKEEPEEETTAETEKPEAKTESEVAA